MPTLEQIEAGDYPAYSPAPPGTGSVVSPFRRIHNNMLMCNYNSLSGVTLDDAGSRTLFFNNYVQYSVYGVGESCHESQWVLGVGNVYAYTGTYSLISSEGPSPLGIRTFFYNSTLLLLTDAEWCDEQEPTRLN